MTCSPEKGGVAFVDLQFLHDSSSHSLCPSRATMSSKEVHRCVFVSAVWSNRT